MNIKEILSSKEGLNLVMGDALRILAMYRRLWLSELYAEMTSLSLTLGERPCSMKDLKKAIEKLQKLGLVKYEKKLHSMAIRDVIEEPLISINLEPTQLIHILNDERFKRYQAIRYEIFKLK